MYIIFVLWYEYYVVSIATYLNFFSSHSVYRFCCFTKLKMMYWNKLPMLFPFWSVFSYLAGSQMYCCWCFILDNYIVKRFRKIPEAHVDGFVKFDCFFHYLVDNKYRVDLLFFTFSWPFYFWWYNFVNSFRTALRLIPR